MKLRRNVFTYFLLSFAVIVFSCEEGYDELAPEDEAFDDQISARKKDTKDKKKDTKDEKKEDEGASGCVDIWASSTCASYASKDYCKYTSIRNNCCKTCKNSGTDGSTNSTGGVSSGLVPCTRKPVGVPFPTPGGNASFGICKDGKPPSAWAQGVTIWDPNEGRSFTGTCQRIEQYAREGYLSNNMCMITRVRLDGICCSNPTNSTGDSNGNWTWH